MNGSRLPAVATLLAAFAATAATAADRHVGVASCASGVCHGAANLAGGRIRQDEYLVWQHQDRHARAFAALRGELARRIAANLGLGEPTAARDCLVCHADFVPKAERGERHQLDDGVGCEACHGAAERWLSAHAAGYANNAARAAAGLYPTWEPKARAELCASCHVGSPERPMTHVILGAGHPPLLFELDTFGALEPPHHGIDADYVARKGKADDARLWIAGQVAASRALLVGLGTTPADALFPELAWFDCNACHHPMQPPRWEPGQGTGLRPGRARVADSPMYFVGLWLDVAAPALAARWRDGVRAVHGATVGTGRDLRAQAQALLKLLDGEVQPLAAREATGAQVRQLALAVVEQGAGPRAADFSVAEQTAMATAVFATALEQGTGAKASQGLQDAVAAVYAAVEDRMRYEPAKMREALMRVREQLEKAFPARPAGKAGG